MEHSDSQGIMPFAMPNIFQDFHSQSDSDILPNATWPQPSGVDRDGFALPTRYVPDPALFVTPEKPNKQHRVGGCLTSHDDRSNTHEVPLRFTSMLDDSDETGEPRVRFNSTVNVKRLSPETSTIQTEQNKQQLSMNEIQAEIVKLAGLSNLTQQNGTPDKQQKQKNTNLKSKQTDEKQYLYPLSNFMKSSSLEENNELVTASVDMKVKSLPGKDTSPTRLVVMDTFKTMGSKDFINCIDDEEGDANVQREPESRIDLHHHVWAEHLCEDADIEIETILPESCKNKPWENPVSSFSETNRAKKFSSVKLRNTGECVLNRPEFNSSLWMNADLQQLKQSDLDLTAALQEKLKIPSTKAKVAEKVYTRLNMQSPAFPSSPLVGVHVIEEDLVDNVSRQRAARARPTHKQKITKPEDQLERKPDLMEYFTPELQKETACLVLRSAPLLPNGLTIANMERTFDQYKHLRSWEGW